ncbi:MAG: succinate dehydrogenase/fumarate reductase iron-sulfur subunit [Candidatus Omnitrophota bacterium]
MSKKITVTLKIWRQKNPSDKGRLEAYRLEHVDTQWSFLEMLDQANINLVREGNDPIAFESGCRKGSCGACGAVVNGRAHGPEKGKTLCQLKMESFEDNSIIVVEPFRAKAFAVIKDLVVDRSAFDRMLRAGGDILSNNDGVLPGGEGAVDKRDNDLALLAAACIGCGACVAACPGASALLFLSSQVSHLRLLPRGEAQKAERLLCLVEQMDREGFGSCVNQQECESVCPKGIKVTHIARLNRDYLAAYKQKSKRKTTK